MGKKKEILKQLEEAAKYISMINPNNEAAHIRNCTLQADYYINKAAMIVREGKTKQTSCGGLNLCGVTNSNLTAKIDDTTAFGCPHHNHNKHRVYVDALSHKEALLLQKIINNLLR